MSESGMDGEGPMNGADILTYFSNEQRSKCRAFSGVVASYLASQARDPGIDSHQHQKDS